MQIECSTTFATYPAHFSPVLLLCSAWLLRQLSEISAAGALFLCLVFAFTFAFILFIHLEMAYARSSLCSGTLDKVLCAEVLRKAPLVGGSSSTPTTVTGRWTLLDRGRRDRHLLACARMLPCASAQQSDWLAPSLSDLKLPGQECPVAAAS